MTPAIELVWGTMCVVYLFEILLNAPTARGQSVRCNMEIERKLTTVPVFYYAPKRAVKKGAVKCVA